MTIQEFMRRWLLRYVREDYFKIPMRKKKEEFELPDALKVHYRYTDIYNMIEEDVSRSKKFGEVKKNNFIIKIYSSPNSSSEYTTVKQVLSCFTLNQLSFPMSHTDTLRYCASDHYGQGGKKILSSIFGNYSFIENCGGDCGTVKSYLTYNDTLWGVSDRSISNTYTHLDFSFDFKSAWWDRWSNEDQSGDYGNTFYGFRHQDQFYKLIEDSVKIEEDKVSNELIWFRRYYWIDSSTSGDVHLVTEITPKRSEISRTKYSDYDTYSFSTFYVDDFSEMYLRKFFDNKEFQLKKLEAEKEGLI